MVSIISVGNEAVNGDSQFGWSDDEEDVGVQNLLKLIDDGFPFKHSFFYGRCFKIRCCKNAGRNKK